MWDDDRRGPHVRLRLGALLETMMGGVRPPAARVSFRRRLGRVRMAAFGPRKVQFVAQLQAQRRQVFEPESRPCACESWPARKAKSLRLATRSISRAQSPQACRPGGAWQVQDRDVGGVRQPARPPRPRQPDDPQRPPRGKFEPVEKENSPRHSAGRQFSSVATS